MDQSDMGLLGKYAANASDEAFETLVSRWIDFVYVAALRQTRDATMAEEVTQAVFIILAQKAKQMPAGTILSGWLFRTTRYVALSQMRTNARRRQREQEAHMRTEFETEQLDKGVEQIWPLLDEALAQLGEKDRQALLLRFFEKKSLADVGGALGTGEDSARMRVNRALERLRSYFMKRGVQSTTEAISCALAASPVNAHLTAALAKTISAAAIAKAATATQSTLTIIKGALKLMAWTKGKTATAVVIGLLLAAGAATVGIRKYVAHERSYYSWRIAGLKPAILSNAEPQVTILPTKFGPSIHGQVWAPPDKYAAVGATVIEMAWIAYRATPGRVYFPDGTPQQRYDFATTIPESPKEGLQRELKQRLGYVGQREEIAQDVLVLRLKRPNAPQLKPHDPMRGSTGYYDEPSRHLVSLGRPISYQESGGAPLGLVKLLEGLLHIPVIDETGLTEKYDIEIRWQGVVGDNNEGLKQAVLEQAGLELVPDRRTVEMLVMKKVK